MLRMKDWLFMHVALVACDGTTEPEAPAAVAPRDTRAAVQPAPSKDVQLKTKHNPVVMDL